MKRWLFGLVVSVVAIILVGAVAASNHQEPAIHADSSAVVVLADNRTPVPVEMFLKIRLTYHKLDPTCPPLTRCLYVVPSVQLGATDTFQVSGLPHGETEPDDSPPQARIPGRISSLLYLIAPPPAAAPERA